MRSLADIETELKAASYEAEKLRGIVSALSNERLDFLRHRERQIVADFDAGMGRKAIAAKHKMNIQTLSGALFRNNRHYRKKVVPLTHLPAEQQRAYAKAKRNGMGPAAARAFALATPVPA